MGGASLAQGQCSDVILVVERLPVTQLLAGEHVVQMNS